MGEIERGVGAEGERSPVVAVLENYYLVVS